MIQLGYSKKECTGRRNEVKDIQVPSEGHGPLESNKGATSGSQVKLCHSETKAVLLLHKPHSGDEMANAAVDSAAKFLKEYSHI